jgi:hypothetical protein
MMHKELIAKELVQVAGDLIALERIAKGDVPEAFKKQWKKNDKGGDKSDDKKDDKLPDFIKDKKKKASNAEIAERLVMVAKVLLSKGEVPEAFKKQWKNKDKEKKSSDGDIAAALVEVAKMLAG